MSVSQVKNRNLVPNVGNEGYFTKPIHITAINKYDASTYDRLYSHHTLNTIRKLSFFHQYAVPRDSLDLAISADYNHSCELFPDKIDVGLQPETKGKSTWRRLRNTTDSITQAVIHLGHPITYGGISERISPHSVKLMNSGVHSSQTNPGYSRQPAGDRAICCKWINKLCEMKCSDELVKKHRNEFFRFLLGIMHRGTLQEFDPKELPQINIHGKQILVKDREFKSFWSNDQRTYIAVRPIPGKGALLYMAVSKYPELGWDIPNRNIIY